MSYITENYRTDRINKTSTNSDKMKRVLLTLSMSIATLVGTLAQNEPYKNHQLSPKERADDLLGRLTLKEKIGLMQNSSNAVERLGIAPYNWCVILSKKKHDSKNNKGSLDISGSHCVGYCCHLCLYLKGLDWLYASCRGT